MIAYLCAFDNDIPSFNYYPNDGRWPSLPATLRHSIDAIAHGETWVARYDSAFSRGSSAELPIAAHSAILSSRAKDDLHLCNDDIGRQWTQPTAKDKRVPALHPAVELSSLDILRRPREYRETGPSIVDLGCSGRFTPRNLLIRPGISRSETRSLRPDLPTQIAPTRSTGSP